MALTLAAAASLALPAALGGSAALASPAGVGTSTRPGTIAPPRAPAGANTAAPVTVGLCSAPRAREALAADLSRDITAAMHGRSGHIALSIQDAVTGAQCSDNQSARSHSASVVKATILAALLYWRQQTHTSLTSTEQAEATSMIELSDNDAATYLWNDVGHARLGQFVAAAAMTQTQLDTGAAWGLSEITAHDELALMRLLTEPNQVLATSARQYELNLMNHVVSYERWGVPDGAPSGLTVYVKNGWLNDPVEWVINSIGAVEGHGRDYKMAILTYDNPSEAYGIDTVERIAEAVNRDLNAGLPAAGTPLAVTLPPAEQGQPDEVIPAGAR
jgi:hypothetical protein